MRTIIKYFGVILCLLIFVSVLSCGKRTVSECQLKKIQLLLEDFLKKERCFSIMKTVHESLNKNVIIPPDSSMYFGYLYSPKLKIPNKEFYLHWDKELAPIYPDSVKLRVIKDLSEMGALAFVVGINLSEVNEDTTKLKLSFDSGIGSGIGKSISRGGTFTYSFNEKNCKWVVLDSTFSLSITK